MSPEVYSSQHPFDGAAVDIWTAGTILFCMLSGTPSYQVPHDNDPQFNWMVHALRRLVSDWGINLSEQVLHLLENMLQVDPRPRLTLDEVLLHPWMSLPDALPFLSHRPHDMSGIPERQEEP
jgi:serine/threonine protein kinase